MKKMAFVIAATALFAFAPLADRLGPVLSSLSLVWFAVLLALIASGTVHSIAIFSGAFGALGGGVLASISPAAFGAVLVLAAFAERTTRVRSYTARAVHVLVAVVGGALAGSISSAFANASILVFTVAAIVAAVLASLPLMIDADDPVAHALEEASSLVAEPAKRSLREGAELRRSALDVPLDRKTAHRVRTMWQSLLRLAEARIRLERTRPLSLPPVEGEVAPSSASGPSPAVSVLEMVDQRIAEHVSVLSRAFVAVDTFSAARVGLDDAALKNVATMGESLDNASQALVELGTEERVTSSG